MVLNDVARSTSSRSAHQYIKIATLTNRERENKPSAHDVTPLYQMYKITPEKKHPCIALRYQPIICSTENKNTHTQLINRPHRSNINSPSFGQVFDTVSGFERNLILISLFFSNAYAIYYHIIWSIRFLKRKSKVSSKFA